MVESLPTKQKIFRMFHIVLPILITQVAMYLISFFDILMSGRYSSADLAGVAVGTSIWMPIYIGLAGILASITPIVAHLNGAKNEAEIKRVVQQGIYVALLLSFIVFIILMFSVEKILHLMPLEARVSEIAEKFIHGMMFGLIPLFILSVLRSYMDALGKTRITMLITLFLAPITVFFNYLLIFGNWGFPELGGAGSGYASSIAMWVVCIIAIVVIYSLQPFKNYQIFNNWSKVDFRRWKEIMKMGVPIGLSIFAEVSIFSVVTLMMGNYTTSVISAHQIAINFTSLLYMVPLSISFGATVLIGNELGANRTKDAATYSKLAVSAAVLFSGISAMIIYFLRENIANVYTSDVEVIALAVHFFGFAVLFQLSDAVQASVQGSLRGYKDVNVTFIMAILSYWVIGLPLGYIVANYTSFGPFGYWIGLIAGLTVGAITLSIRLITIQRKLV